MALDLERIIAMCESEIELGRGYTPRWTSREMQPIAADLLRLLENQRTDPHLQEQIRRLTEENAALLAENLRLMGMTHAPDLVSE